MRVGKAARVLLSEMVKATSKAKRRKNKRRQCCDYWSRALPTSIAVVKTYPKLGQENLCWNNVCPSTANSLGTMWTNMDVKRFCIQTVAPNALVKMVKMVKLVKM